MGYTEDDLAFLIKIGQIAPAEIKESKPIKAIPTEKDED
jgi:hypothetical protein